MATNKIKELLKEIINIKGAIFCHVKIIKHWVHFKLLITWGNQKCKGAIPVFIIKANKIKVSINSKFKFSERKKFAEKEKIKIIEAIACVKKYLIAASVVLEFKLISIRGIILIKFNSKPNQEVNQELAEIAIKVPVIKKIKNINW